MVSLSSLNADASDDCGCVILILFGIGILSELAASNGNGIVVNMINRKLSLGIVLHCTMKCTTDCGLRTTMVSGIWHCCLKLVFLKDEEKAVFKDIHFNTFVCFLSLNYPPF